MIYYLLEMYEEAITDFKRAVRAKPNFVDAYFNMGTAFSALGQTQEAINAYRKALEINPHNAYTHWNLAINLEKIDDIEGAIEHWEKYIQFVLGVFRNPEAEKHLAELKARREKRRK
jgi:tetratricopeptide (TPR) repeat protein